MSDKLNKIVEGTIDKISQQSIDDNNLYQFEDYPVGGITNEQMTNALTSSQSGFYQTNSVYMCIDGGEGKTYLKNHFYRLNVTSWEDVTPEFAGKIEEKTLEELESTTIEDSTLYAIEDYPIGGITQAQMTNALKITQRGFYKVNSVYLCVDGDESSTYVKNHFYKFTYDETTDTYSWTDTKAGADIDSELSLESENPVQNKLITESLNNKVSKTGDENIYGIKSFDVRPKLGIGDSLPNEYQEVEYIESTGTQFIDTDFSIFNNTTWDFEFDIEFTRFYDYVALIGVESGVTSHEAWVTADGYFYLRYNNIKPTQIALATNTKYNLKINYDGSTVREYLNSSLKVSYNSSNSLLDSNLYLFRRSSNYASAKIYRVKLSTNSELKFDFIPCYRKEDNTIGLYDLVSSTFFTNSGTGVFLKGENVYRGVDFATIEDVSIAKQELQTQIDDKVSLTKDEVIDGQKIFTERPQIGEIRLPNEFTEVSYIASSGTQYIILPFGFDNTDEVMTKFSIDESQTTDSYIVSPTTWNSNNNRFGMGVDESKYTCAYGSQFTNYTKLTPNRTNDGVAHKWSYKNKIFQVEDESSRCSLDVSSISFGGTTDNLKLFRGYTTNTIGRLYSYIHKKSDGTSVNLIPCYTNQQVTNNSVVYESNTIGLYDIVNNIFYVNNGTGTFTKGQDILTGEYVALQSELPIANEENTTAELSSLKVGDVNYFVSTVNANPEETTETLNGIKINGTNYKIDYSPYKITNISIDSDNIYLTIE